MSAPKIFAAEYYTRMRELEQASWWNAGMRDLAARLFDGAAMPARGLLLDVGCGSGQTMAWFRDRWPEWQTVGLDLAREGLQAARALSDERVLAASALELPLPDASVDALICLDVLQHLPLDGGDRRALSEMRRVLRPGGLLFVRTNAQSLPRIADDTRYDFHKYTTRELRGKLAGAGFTICRIGRVNALLGLAEIPRELRARGAAGGGYAGLLATVPRIGASWRAKLAWLRFENALVAGGASLPLGRTLVALAQVEGGRR